MTKSTIKIEIDLENPPQTIEDTLKTIFWKEKHTTQNAKKLLDYIKFWSQTTSPHKASDWKTYCNKTKITQSQYHTILRRLKKTGLIQKTYNKEQKTHIITPSNKFTDTLNKISQKTLEYMEHKHF